MTLPVPPLDRRTFPPRCRGNCHAREAFSVSARVTLSPAGRSDPHCLSTFQARERGRSPSRGSVRVHGSSTLVWASVVVGALTQMLLVLLARFLSKAFAMSPEKGAVPFYVIARCRLPGVSSERQRASGFTVAPVSFKAECCQQQCLRALKGFQGCVAFLLTRAQCSACPTRSNHGAGAGAGQGARGKGVERNAIALMP